MTADTPADPLDPRAAAILEAARAVLAEKGYAAASMLDVARRARVSKETLYGRFGDKRGLFEALVRTNADTVVPALAEAMGDARLPLETTLERFAVALQTLLLGESALTVNRAAMAEAAADAALGRLLDANGRGRVVPLLAGVLERHRAAGELAYDSVEEPASTLVALVIGDQQVRRLLGALAMPTPDAIEARARRAVRQFLALYGVRR